MVKNENQRLLNVRSEDERLEREEEIRLRSQVLEILSDKQFRQHIDADEYVKQIKEEAQLWINPNDLSREIERMLDEKHDYNFSIDLTGTKQTSTGQKIVDEEKKRSFVTMAPFEYESKKVERKPPGASKYEE